MGLPNKPRFGLPTNSEQRSGSPLRGKARFTLARCGILCPERTFCGETRPDIRPRVRQSVIHVDVEHAIVPTVIRIAAANNEPSAQRGHKTPLLMVSCEAPVYGLKKPPLERHFSAVFVLVLSLRGACPRSKRSLREHAHRPTVMRLAFARRQRDAPRDSSSRSSKR